MSDLCLFYRTFNRLILIEKLSHVIVASPLDSDLKFNQNRLWFNPPDCGLIGYRNSDCIPDIYGFGFACRFWIFKIASGQS